MPVSPTIKIGPLKQSELQEADRIFRLAFGTFVGLPNPSEFMGDRDLLISRWHAPHVTTLAARENGRLIATNQITRWGSFAFFGPLTVLPEYWDRGVAQRLVDATVQIFDKHGLKRTGLFTFAHSAKHVGLYQKFGYWPGYLTALMTHTPTPHESHPAGFLPKTVLLSSLNKTAREQAIAECKRLTNNIDEGLNLGDELRNTRRQNSAEVLLTYGRRSIDGFAICFHGPGSEGGTKMCYIKFAAARSGRSAGDRFSTLLQACDAFARARGVPIEAGMNLAREDAYRRMRAHGFRAFAQGVSMQRPHQPGFNRAGAYVIDDWR